MPSSTGGEPIHAERAIHCPTCSCDLPNGSDSACPGCGTRWTQEALRRHAQMRFLRRFWERVDGEYSWHRLVWAFLWRIAVMALLCSIAGLFLEPVTHHAFYQFLPGALFTLLVFAAVGGSILGPIRRYRRCRAAPEADRGD